MARNSLDVTRVAHALERVAPAMRLLRRREDPERELAKAIAERGVRTLATVKTMRATGKARGDGMADEFELLLSVAAEEGSAPMQAVVRQFMTRPKLAGVETAVEILGRTRVAIEVPRSEPGAVCECEEFINAMDWQARPRAR
jgi:hypothetical protein